MTTSTLRDEPLGEGAVHLCVDMQRLFLPGTDWGLDWLPCVLTRVVAPCEPAPEAMDFTRFVPARHPGEGHGVWAGYWTRWASMTIDTKSARSDRSEDRFGVGNRIRRTGDHPIEIAAKTAYGTRMVSIWNPYARF